MSSDPLASFRLDGRLITVTGASDGLGRTFAEAFAALGARVVLAARRRDKLEEVQRAIASAGGRAEVVVTDLCELTDIRALAADRRAPGRRDDKLVLVNNAGLGFTKPALDVTEAEWDALFDLHVKGTFFCSQQIGALMLARGYGKIINLIFDLGSVDRRRARAHIARPRRRSAISARRCRPSGRRRACASMRWRRPRP